MHEIVEIIVNFCSTFGYIGIFLMMVLESSFIPFPSEVAMIPAGYLSYTGEMNFWIVLLVGTAGALVGATINYGIGYFLGGQKLIGLINKFGKYFFIKESHYHISENYFKKHGIITIFLARFITVVRQIISLPAGVFKINFPKFLIFTGFGAGIWNLILLCIGYFAGQNKELIVQYSHIAVIGGIVVIVLVGIGYFYINKCFEKKYNK